MGRLAPAVVRLQAGQAVSALGDAVLATSAVVWTDRDIAAGRPWAAAAVSGIPAAVYLSVAVAGPLAGVAVDRFDRRAVMAAAELARAILAGGLAALTLLPAGRLPAAAWLAVLYAGVFLLNGAGQFTGPARLAVIAALEPGDTGRARAAGLAEAGTAAAVTVGPLIAVPLTLAAGLRAALAVDAATLIVSWLAARSLPSAAGPARGRGGTLAEFRAGLRCFASSRPLTALLTVTVTCQLGAGALTALNVIAVTGNLHGTARDYGIAEALTGAGYIAGAVAAARLVRLAGARAVTVGGLFTAAALTAAYALARSVPEGLPLLAAYGAAVGLLGTSVAPLLMGAVPGEYLGRAMAIFQPLNQAAGGISVLASGWLAGTVLRGFHAAGIGPVSLLLLAGAALITAAGLRAAAALPPRPAAPAA
jgi:MFS family permease